MNTTTHPSDSHTLCNVRRDFPEWHLGRRHYALWALQVDTAPVRQRMQDAQAHLVHHLLEDYQRQAHITVGLCGFLGAAPQHADDFGLADLQAQLTDLRQLRPAPFGLRVGGLASFTSVPYLSVQADAGHLEALRLCLAGAGMNAAPGPYTPHVTVGLYAGVWPLADLQAQFSRFTATDPLALTLHGISLVSYAPHEIGGPLQTLADYDFASGALRWSRSLPAELQAFAAIR
jgi:2'-5' RNA ligase